MHYGYPETMRDIMELERKEESGKRIWRTLPYMQVLSSALFRTCGRINKISKRYSFSEQTRIKKEITKIMDPFK